MRRSPARIIVWSSTMMIRFERSWGMGFPKIAVVDSGRHRRRTRASVGRVRCRSEVDGEAADVLPRHAVRIDGVEKVRRVVRARDLDAEEKLEIEQEMQRLRDAHVHALAAVVAAGAAL